MWNVNWMDVLLLLILPYPNKASFSIKCGFIHILAPNYLHTATYTYVHLLKKFIGFMLIWCLIRSP